MCLVCIEMCCEYKMYTRFQRLSMKKKEYKISHNTLTLSALWCWAHIIHPTRFLVEALSRGPPGQCFSFSSQPDFSPPLRGWPMRAQILASIMPSMQKEMAPTPVFLPGESQDGGAWWAAVYGVTQSRTRLKRLSGGSSSALHPSMLLQIAKFHCFMTEWYPILCVMYDTFFRSSVDEHLGFFHILAIVNNIVTNIEVHVSFQKKNHITSLYWLHIQIIFWICQIKH